MNPRTSVNHHEAERQFFDIALNHMNNQIGQVDWASLQGLFGRPVINEYSSQHNASREDSPTSGLSKKTLKQKHILKGAHVGQINGAWACDEISLDVMLTWPVYPPYWIAGNR